jgi:hypothetical protein
MVPGRTRRVEVLQGKSYYRKQGEWITGGLNNLWLLYLVIL